MFQTEPIVFLQVHGGALLDRLMVFVSVFGYPVFYLVALSVIVFAVDFRRGFLLLQLLLWTGALTEVLKNVVAFPRPYDADASVLDVARGRVVRTELAGMGGKSLFDLPQQPALDLIRGRDDPSFGFPSGHSSGCAAFAGGLALLWNSRRGAVVAVLAALLMATSRMYLGRHFPADVLGGLALGTALLATVAWWVARNDGEVRLPYGMRPGPAAALLLPPLGLLALSLRPDGAGLFFGINLGFLLVARHGLPVDTAPASQRAARAALAIAMVGGSGALARGVAGALGSTGDTVLVAFALGAVPGVVLVWGTTALALRTGLYAGRE